MTNGKNSVQKQGWVQFGCQKDKKEGKKHGQKFAKAV